MDPEDPTAYVSARLGSPRTSPPFATRRTRSGSSPSTAPPSCLRRNARWSTRWLPRSPRGNGTRSSSTRRSSNVATWRTWSAAARTASSWSPERARCSRGTRRWRGSRATSRTRWWSSFGRGSPDPRRAERGGITPTELALGVVEPQDALILRRDGSDRWIRYSSSTMPERQGSGTSHVVTARDVTAELEAEQMKRDFVATVSHELRTPLTPLKGLLQSLNKGLVEDSLRHAASTTRSCCARPNDWSGSFPISSMSHASMTGTCRWTQFRWSSVRSWNARSRTRAN